MNYFHYTYITKHVDGKYYVGRHSTKRLNDGYLGSGKWVRSIKDRKLLSKEILKFYPNTETLIEAEEILIKENIENELCMNFNLSPVGFSVGEFNPSKTEESRQRNSERLMGENNPFYGKTHSEESKQKISDSTKGENNPFYGKTHSEESKNIISNKNKGLKRSAECKEAQSKKAIEDYASGKRKPHSKSGWTHSEESKINSSEIAKNRPRIICHYCGMSLTKQNFVRFHQDMSCLNRTKQKSNADPFTCENPITHES